MITTPAVAVVQPKCAAMTASDRPSREPDAMPSLALLVKVGLGSQFKENDRGGHQRSTDAEGEREALTFDTGCLNSSKP